MLEDLKKYNNLGTPKFYWEMFEVLKKSESPWTKTSLLNLFSNRSINGRARFDGCIELSIAIQVLNLSEDGTLHITPNFFNVDDSLDTFSKRFIKHLFEALKKDPVAFEIFSPQNISADLLSQTIKITNQAFGFSFSSFKQLLIDFEVLTYHFSDVSQYYLVSRTYLTLLENELLAEIKKQLLSPEHLKFLLEIQSQKGLEAEQFIYEHEQKRLNYKVGIQWVAKYSVSEGYDIASFDTTESISNDRFIEVKSFTGNTPHFYWSRNEIEVARLKGIRYYLYLVNHKKIHIPTYAPLIIQNPYEAVIQNEEWDKVAENYFVSPA